MQRSPDSRNEMQTAVVWPDFAFIRAGQNHLVKHSEREKKRKVNKRIGGNRQAWKLASPRGQWKTGLSGGSGDKVICRSPTALAVKGLMIVCLFVVVLRHSNSI